MVYTREDFHSRVGILSKKSAGRGKNTFVYRIDNNGVRIIKAKRHGFRLPVKGVVLMIIGFLCLKALMLSANGPQAYADRLAILENGTLVEVMGARVLAVDPVTQFIADQTGPMFR